MHGVCNTDIIPYDQIFSINKDDVGCVIYLCVPRELLFPAERLETLENNH